MKSTEGQTTMTNPAKTIIDPTYTGSYYDVLFGFATVWTGKAASESDAIARCKAVDSHMAQIDGLVAEQVSWLEIARREAREHECWLAHSATPEQAAADLESLC